MSKVYRPLIDGHEDQVPEEKDDQTIQIIYKYSKKIFISDSGNQGTYTSSFSLKNISNQPITIDSLQITTGEHNPQPIVDTQLLIPDTSNKWSDFIEFEDLGTLEPGKETEEYEFTYSIVRAIAGPPLPDEYTNNIYFFPSYTVNSKYQPKLIYDVIVVKTQTV